MSRATSCREVLFHPLELPSFVQKIIKRFREANFQIYLVGGIVRDRLLEIDNSDYDFTTNALPEEGEKLFPKSFPASAKHGTIVVQDEKGIPYEITTFRKDGPYLDHRRPEKVTFTTELTKDLSRRDFTINALVYDFKTQTILDYHKGISDLKKQIIRTIGNAKERFNEDALRMLRACRFCAKLGFNLSEETQLAIEENRHLINNISQERIRDELSKIICSPQPSKGMELLRETRLLEIILPEIQNTYGVKQNKFHEFDVYYHSLKVLEKIKNNRTLRLAALLHDVAKPLTKQQISKDVEPTFYKHEILGSKMTKKILGRLKLPKKEIQLVSHLIRHHMFYYQKVWNDSTVKRFIRKVGKDNLALLFELRKADRLGKGKVKITENNDDLEELAARIATIMEKNECLDLKDLKISGTDLMERTNLKPGPLIGKTLNHLLELVMQNPELNKKEVLVSYAEKYLTKNHFTSSR